MSIEKDLIPAVEALLQSIADAEQWLADKPAYGRILAVTHRVNIAMTRAEQESIATRKLLATIHAVAQDLSRNATARLSDIKQLADTTVAPELSRRPLTGTLAEICEPAVIGQDRKDW